MCLCSKSRKLTSVLPASFTPRLFPASHTSLASFTPKMFHATPVFQFPWLRLCNVVLVFQYYFFACEHYAQAVSFYLRFACELYAQAHVEHASFAPGLCGFACELHAQARQTFCVGDFSLLLLACGQRLAGHMLFMVSPNSHLQQCGAQRQMFRSRFFNCVSRSRLSRGTSPCSCCTAWSN